MKKRRGDEWRGESNRAGEEGEEGSDTVDSETTVRRLDWLQTRAQVGDMNVLSLPHT